MPLFTLILVSMLCRASGRASLRHAGLAGILGALGLAIRAAGVEPGLATWVVCLMACGALAPMLLLVLDAAGRRLAPVPAGRRLRVSAAVE